MALIEFKNLPDTSTPINAENLNNNFNELNTSIVETNKKATKEEMIDFNSYSDFATLFRDLVANKGKMCKGDIGNLHQTNLKTLLGNPNIGNYTNCVFEVLINYNTTEGCVRITAYAPYTAEVRVAYLNVASNDIQYTGWKEI